jgi:RHS repeat-associated protein
LCCRAGVGGCRRRWAWSSFEAIRPDRPIRAKLDYDSAGNTTSNGAVGFTYTGAGRMTSASGSAGSATFAVNALGQRVGKTSSGTTTLFAYDEAGHLVGEYTGAGALIEETVWLGDIPIATLRPKAGGGVDIYYVHTDHLNTPCRVSRPTDNSIVWRWTSDPYGNGFVDEDPDADGAPFPYNLRFPGQYYDVETGLVYNGARYYDQQSGRYAQSDPIGLAGGSYSTYAYADGNPITNIDPDGLAPPNHTATPTFPTVLPPNIAIPGTPENNGFVQSFWQWMMNSGANSSPVVTPNSNTQTAPNCPNNDECDQLNQNVQKAKVQVGSLGACRAGMTIDQLTERYYAWLNLATARSMRDQKCWNGGDDGHQQAQAAAWTQVGSCARLLGR